MTIKSLASMVRITAILCFTSILPLQLAAADKLVLAHYMPWYASEPISGEWGWHWTMNHFDPATTDTNGLPEIASHYHPLLGPYDSSDVEALTCQVQQMKLAGIDGIIIDWYGIHDYRDYRQIHANTQAIIAVIKAANMQFAICYEDQSIKHMVTGDAMPEAEAVARGRAVFEWMDTHWFTDPAYVMEDGKPVVLCFGPQYFEATQWPQILAGHRHEPLLFTLPHLTKTIPGSMPYAWIPVHGGDETPPEEWRTYLSWISDRGDQGETVIPAAFHQFHDIYAEAQLHRSYGSLDAQGTETVRETLERAFASTGPIIQLVTWNDYGEGTMFEPTHELGYANLELVQATLRERGRISHIPDDLRLPLAIIEQRRALQDDPERLAALKHA